MTEPGFSGIPRPRSDTIHPTGAGTRTTAHRTRGLCSTVDDMRKSPSSPLLLVAVVVFLVGLAAIVALFVTPAVTDDTAPTVVYLLTMCAPIGLLLAVIFALRSGRRVR